ncbi:MAG: hypothetical protein KBC96_06150 [Armatimonadetes bacterium]|nr:hypothetical protein [Armatimonadota bacterium]
MSVKPRIAILIIAAAFCAMTTAASAAEISLAGIRLGRSCLNVLQKYGDPSEVRVGARAQGDPQAGGAQMPGGLPGMGMEVPPGMGIEMPPGLAMPGAPQAQAQQANAREITWIYRFSQNRTLEFIIDPEGRVLQITAVGAQWSGLRTAKGIILGSTYKQVIMAYGFPESHERSGIELVTRYADSDRVAFTLVGNQVVSITIAFMD